METYFYLRSPRIGFDFYQILFFKEKTLNLKKDLTDPIDTALVFEPFHTVDYFASQGIKFKEEEKPKVEEDLKLVIEKLFIQEIKT